ncbi:hypothetical protein BDD12DRAFT_901795 [Trichophaea hybrida]|nr:hypothetical protein BDD12DRAFT_901795 [Trichophaea hybrida]
MTRTVDLETCRFQPEPDPEAPEGNKVIKEQDNMKQELLLTQQKLRTMEERNPECNHGDVEEKVRNFEQLLEENNPDLAKLKQDLEDAQA